MSVVSYRIWFGRPYSIGRPCEIGAQLPRKIDMSTMEIDPSHIIVSYMVGLGRRRRIEGSYIIRYDSSEVPNSIGLGDRPAL